MTLEIAENRASVGELSGRGKKIDERPTEDIIPGMMKADVSRTVIVQPKIVFQMDFNA